MPTPSCVPGVCPFLVPMLSAHAFWMLVGCWLALAIRCHVLGSRLQVLDFREQLGAFPAYFAGLGTAAARASVAVELCMATPLHVFSAAAFSHMTSMRVGEDYDW